MENSAIYILLIFLGALSVLLVPMIIEYFKEYFDDIEYAKMELERSEKWKEIVYWKKELSALRWSLIPGITPARVRAIRRFFGDRKKKDKEKSDGIFSMLMPSFLGICVCSVCLLGTTFAWFNANESTGVNTFTAANFLVQATVTKEDSIVIAADNGVYKLEVGKYSVNLVAAGSADNGYAVLSFDGKDEISTGKILKSDIDGITVTLEITAPTILKVVSKWGEGWAEPPIVEITYPEKASEIIEARYTDYTVKSGDTLYSIATANNISVDELKKLNGLNSSDIIAGQLLKIPN